MRFVLLITLFLTISFSLVAQNVALGVVYLDANGNGKKDKKEKGIANVAVSNGSDVVLTDKDGKYKLSVGDDNIIFMIKPSGYKIELDEYNKPKYYYIHKPEGSPSLYYAGTAPTGNLPKSIDFGLTKYDESETFSSFIFGDTQLYFEKEAEYLKKGIIDDANKRQGLSFGITLGDLVGDDLNLHPIYKNTIKQMNLPWYNIIGNHDKNYDVKNDSLSDETFESNFGPATYAFNYGKAHFLVLDDVRYPHPTQGKSGYLGGLREDQFKFIENDLSHIPSDHLIVIAMHIPLFDEKDDDAFRESDRKRLYTLLKKYPNVLVLSAHTHIQYNNLIGEKEGLNREKPIHEYNVGTTCGDWYSGILDEKGVPVSMMRDGTPKGYAILNVKGNEYTIDYKAAGKADEYQISIYNPRVVPYKGRWVTAGIYANFFMGMEGDLVEFRVDNGAWAKMKKIDDYDPAYYRYVQDWDFDSNVKPERRPSNPQMSRHLWHAKIPVNLPIGIHTIEVRAKDIYGKTHTQTSSYEIKELK